MMTRMGQQRLIINYTFCDCGRFWGFLFPETRWTGQEKVKGETHKRSRRLKVRRGRRRRGGRRATLCHDRRHVVAVPLSFAAELGFSRQEIVLRDRVSSCEGVIDAVLIRALEWWNYGGIKPSQKRGLFRAEWVEG